MPAAEWMAAPVPDGAADLERVGLPRWMAVLLARRGVTDESEARRFLTPSLDQLHDLDQLLAALRRRAYEHKTILYGALVRVVPRVQVMPARLAEWAARTKPAVEDVRQSDDMLEMLGARVAIRDRLIETRSLREMRMDEMIAKKGIEEVVRKTVDGMIPRNKLRTPRMKNLVVKA